jgi:hypothetical protein
MFPWNIRLSDSMDAALALVGNEKHISSIKKISSDNMAPNRLRIS